MMSDVRSAFDDAVRSDEDVMFQNNRFAIDVLLKLQGAPVGVGDVDRHERCDIAVVADLEASAFAVYQREGADKHVLAELRLADDPHERVKRVLGKRGRFGERAHEIGMLHGGSVR